MSSLPLDFKARFESFRTLYDKLSGDMHTAGGNANLFEWAIAKIKEHFEARRLFRL